MEKTNEKTAKGATRDAARATRWEFGPDGAAEIEVEWDRIGQKTTMKVNGKPAWGVCGKWAEKFFLRYGLLIK